MNESGLVYTQLFLRLTMWTHFHHAQISLHAKVCTQLSGPRPLLLEAVNYYYYYKVVHDVEGFCY